MIFNVPLWLIAIGAVLLGVIIGVAAVYLNAIAYWWRRK